jgi:hypothetical protein
MPNSNQNPGQNPNAEAAACLASAMAELARHGTASVVMAGPEVEIPPDAATADDNRNPRRRRNGDGEAIEMGELIQPEARHDMANLVLFEDAKADILGGIRQIEMRADLERIWSISRIQPMNGRCVLNFYGPPGTGKTRAALAVAWRLHKPLFQVNYAGIISKYLGDTAKHITLAFRQAAEAGAVLFFDEADSLLSKRVNMDQSCATSINQNRNTLMQCLDQFNGVVILTTNLFGNYDEALLRRIAKHVRFDLPNKSMRKRLFELHLPVASRVQADLDVLARSSKGLSGGDIFNVCLNGILSASTDENPDRWLLTQAILAREIEAVLSAKAAHAGRPSAPAAS